jgi:hypothetical protein
MQGENMVPRKPTIDDVDDIDDEDGVVEEEISRPTDLDLTVADADDVGLGGGPSNPEQEEER